MCLAASWETGNSSDLLKRKKSGGRQYRAEMAVSHNRLDLCSFCSASLALGFHHQASLIAQDGVRKPSHLHHQTGFPGTSPKNFCFYIILFLYKGDKKMYFVSWTHQPGLLLIKKKGEWISCRQSTNTS